MDYTGMSARGSDLVGSINGKEITYPEFANILKEYTENQKASTGMDLTDAQLKQARDQVWQSLVTRELLKGQIAALGIHISDQEIVDWVRGDNPPEDLRRNFVDSTGQFRRDVYDQFLNDPNQFLKDPEGLDAKYGTKWLATYEEHLRDRRAQERLQSIVNASIQISEGELQQKFHDQNVKYELLYALFDANQLVPDSLVTPSEDDIRSYYNDHLDQQKVDATRKLKFVQIRETASPGDTADVKSQMEELAARARKGDDFIELVYAYDESPDSGTYFKRGEMTPTLESAAFSAKQGEVVGPVLETDGYHLLKVLSSKASDQDFVHASHILFSVDASADSQAVKATAQQVAREARGGADFGALAKQHSKDPGSAERNGDLGWFGKGRMVKPFEEAAFNARPGEIVGPIRSQFGWHIIKVHARESREVKVGDILMPIQPSSQTKADISDRARDIAYNAQQTDLVTEAQSMGLEVREAVVKEKGGVIPGLGVNEPAVRWAFSNSIGDVSEPFNVPNGYAIFMIVEARDSGLRPFEEVRETLRPAVIRQLKVKKADALASDARAQLGPSDSLSKLQEINPIVRVQRAGPATLGGSIPGIGREQTVFGVIAALNPGQISGAVESTRGAFLIQLISKTEFDSVAYKSQRETLQAQIMKDRKGKLFNDWIAKLREQADIVDNRDIFFR
jgi:parvulin-like peptidyl-prolyl isomerase